MVAGYGTAIHAYAMKLVVRAKYWSRIDNK